VFSRVFYGWYIVAAGMGVHFLVSLSWGYGAQLFFSPILMETGWNRALMSGAYSLQRLEGSIITPIEGFLVDRIGPRWMMVAGAFLAGAGLMLLSVSTQVWMFYAGVLITSLGTSTCVGIPRTWTIVQWFRRLRGRAMSFAWMGPVITGPLLIVIVWLIETLGWRGALQVLAVVLWTVCIPLGMVFKARPEHVPPDGGLGPAVAPPADGKRARQAVADEIDFTVKQALRSRAFWALVLLFSAHGMGIGGMFVHMVPYFESIGFSPAQAASVLGFYTVLSIFGRLGSGWAFDFLDRRLVLAVILAFEALALLLLANISSYWMVIPFAFLFGTSFGAMLPGQGLVVSRYFGSKNFGTIQGLVQSGTVLTGVIAPVLLGAMFDVTGSYVPAVYILAAAAAAGVPIALVVLPGRAVPAKA
jgi:MFS family permease